MSSNRVRVTNFCCRRRKRSDSPTITGQPFVHNHQYAVASLNISTVHSLGVCLHACNLIKTNKCVRTSCWIKTCSTSFSISYTSSLHLCRKTLPVLWAFPRVEKKMMNNIVALDSPSMRKYAAEKNIWNAALLCWMCRTPSYKKLTL